MRIYLISFVISLVIVSVSTMVTYNVIDYLYPSATKDGYRDAPTDNIGKSLFLNFILGAAVFITVIRILRRNQKQ